MWTQRDMDIAKLESEIKIKKWYEEWQRSFLAERMFQQAQQELGLPESEGQLQQKLASQQFEE